MILGKNLSQKFIQQLYLQENIVSCCPIELCQKLGVKISINLLEELDINIPQETLQENYLDQGRLHQELMSIKLQLIQKLKKNKKQQLRTLEEDNKNIADFIQAQATLPELQIYKNKSQQLDQEPHNKEQKEYCIFAWQAYLDASQKLPQFKLFLEAKIHQYENKSRKNIKNIKNIKR